MKYEGSHLLTKPMGELQELLVGKIMSFIWEGDKITAICHELVQEGTIVAKFRVWYQEPRSGGGSGGDPYSHTAALAPRLSEIKDLEILNGPQKVGDFLITP